MAADEGASGLSGRGEPEEREKEEDHGVEIVRFPLMVSLPLIFKMMRSRLTALASHVGALPSRTP
jgi:hypothetical protein